MSEGANCFNGSSTLISISLKFYRQQKQLYLDQNVGEREGGRTDQQYCTFPSLEVNVTAVRERGGTDSFLWKFLPSDAEPSRSSSKPMETPAIFITIVTVTAFGLEGYFLPHRLCVCVRKRSDLAVALPLLQSKNPTHPVSYLFICVCLFIVF